MVTSISGIHFVCSVGECSEEEVLVIGLEIVHIVTAMIHIGTSIISVVYSYKIRTIILKVLPVHIVAAKLQILKEKTSVHLNIGKRKEREEPDGGEGDESNDGIVDT